MLPYVAYRPYMEIKSYILRFIAVRYNPFQQSQEKSKAKITRGSA